jgi:hypothetical protein
VDPARPYLRSGSEDIYTLPGMHEYAQQGYHQRTA